MVYLMRLERVMERTGLTRSPIYMQMKDGIFPSSVKIDERACAWISTEIDAYVNARIAGKSNDELRALCLALKAKRSNGGY